MARTFLRYARPHVGVLVGMMLLAACGDDAPASGAGGAGGDAGMEPRTQQELFELGPHEVGYRVMELSYPAVASGETRTLPVYVWYPAAEDSGAEAATYSVASIAQIESMLALDAPPVAAGTHPLTIYSHGSGGEGLLAYPYGELMASNGWIVVGPNHVGNTVLDGLTGNATTLARTALNRPADITAVLDWLESGLTGDDLTGAAETDRVMLFGHSFGAYTTLSAGGADQDFDRLQAQACGGGDESNCATLMDADVEAAYRAGFGDERIVAIAPQAPALVGTMGAGELAGLAVPTMLMTARRDQTTTQEAEAEPAWMGLDAPDDIWVEMPDGGHFSFITICDDIDPVLLATFVSAEDDGCNETFTPTMVAVPVLAAYVMGFARQHVLGETGFDAILKGDPFDDAFVITTR